jgi:hypothetical protein
MNALLELKKHKQSVWLDYIRQDLILGGELKRLVEQDGLGGVIRPSSKRRLMAVRNMMRPSAPQRRAIRLSHRARSTTKSQ